MKAVSGKLTVFVLQWSYMEKLFKYLYDKKYIKISVYCLGSVLIAFALGILIFNVFTSLGPAFSFLKAILSPLILGVVLAYILDPLVAWISKKVFFKVKSRKKRRAYSVAVTFMIVAAAVALILSILIVTVTRSVSSIDLNDLWAYVQSLETDFSKFWKIVENKLADFNISLGSFGKTASKVFNDVSSALSTLLFANIFAVYFLLDSKIRKYMQMLLELFVSEERREKLSKFAEDADKVFSGYIRGQSIDALLIGIMVAVSLLIAGIPYAVVIGLLTGIGNLIPYVGPFVGFGSLIIICISEGSLAHLLTGVLILAVVMAIDGNIINPRLLSDNVEIHPILVIVALIAGSQIGGIVGMLVAVPVAALIKLQFDTYVERRKLESEEEKKPDQK